MSTSTAKPASSSHSLLSNPHKSSRKKRKKRRGSGSSNASIISIDQVSLNRLRRNHERAAKESKKQRERARKQKQSKLEKLSKTYAANELKEGRSDDDYLSPDLNALSAVSSQSTKAKMDSNPDYSQYTNYDSGSSKDKGIVNMEQVDITADELLPLLRSMVDREQETQTENYRMLEEIRQFETNEKSFRMMLEDEITSLKQQHANLLLNPALFDLGSNGSLNQLLEDLVTIHRDIERGIADQFNEELERRQQDWRNGLLQSQYQQDLEHDDVQTLRQKVGELNKEIDGLFKENGHLRQSMEQLEHQNTSLRVSMNHSNKQLHQMQRLKKINKQLTVDNEALQKQVDEVQAEMMQLLQEQEHREDMFGTSMDTDHRRDSAGSLTREKTLRIGSDRGPHTPTGGVPGHHYNRTIVMGTAGYPGIPGPNGLSDHDSSLGGNDLAHQIADYDKFGVNNDYDSAHATTPDAARPKSRHSSSDPPDRNSTYGDMVEEEEKTPHEDTEEEKTHDDGQQESTTALLQRFRNIGDAELNWDQIQRLLQEKEMKRLQHTGHSAPSQEVLDNYSVESNYSESEQKMEEQLDDLEEEVRELKDLVSQLMHATDRITPHITHSLTPLARKINHMYLMLSTGPMQSRTSAVDEESSMAAMGRRRGRHSHYDSDSEWNETSSQNSARTKSTAATGYWVGYISPWVHDWMPSVGISAILLSTMYLWFKYQNGGRIYGKPKVLRTGRH